MKKLQTNNIPKKYSGNKQTTDNKGKTDSEQHFSTQKIQNAKSKTTLKEKF